jgi:hypothetical protein
LNRLSLVLRKGKEDIKRINNLLTNSNCSSSSSSLNRRQGQTGMDVELVPNTITEAFIRASIIETQNNVDELQQKTKVCLIE